jgi:enoyl-CoA hydratase
LMGGQKVEAPEALAFGLIERIVEGDIVEAARALCADTLAAKPEISGGIKAMCQTP